MKRWLAGGLILVGLIGLVSAGIYLFGQWQVQRPGALALPEQLAGFSLTRSSTGAEAINQINRLHNKIFHLSRGAVGLYGESGEVMIWSAAPPFTFQAQGVLEDMRASIASGRFPFREAGSMDASGVTIYLLQGSGEQMHALFRSGANVVWIQADVVYMEAALTEALAFYR
jgi:hypothetical protein